MPFRRKTNLSRKTKNAKRKRCVVLEETKEEREARLARLRERYAEQCAHETPAEREARLKVYRIRSAIRRNAIAARERRENFEAYLSKNHAKSNSKTKASAKKLPKSKHLQTAKRKSQQKVGAIKIDIDQLVPYESVLQNDNNLLVERCYAPIENI